MGGRPRGRGGPHALLSAVPSAVGVSHAEESPQNSARACPRKSRVAHSLSVGGVHRPGGGGGGAGQSRFSRFYPRPVAYAPPCARRHLPLSRPPTRAPAMRRMAGGARAVLRRRVSAAPPVVAWPWPGKPQRRAGTGCSAPSALHIRWGRASCIGCMPPASPAFGRIPLPPTAAGGHSLHSVQAHLCPPEASVFVLARQKCSICPVGHFGKMVCTPCGPLKAPRLLFTPIFPIPPPPPRQSRLCEGRHGWSTAARPRLSPPLSPRRPTPGP